VITPGHGTFLWRTDGDTAVYKMVSIREVDPLATTAIAPPAKKYSLHGQIEFTGHGVRMTADEGKIWNAGGRRMSPSWSSNGR